MEREFIQQSELDEQTSKFLLTIAGRDSDCGELTKEAEVSVQWKENSINPNKQQKQWNKHWKGV